VIRGELQLNVMTESLAHSDEVSELEVSIRTREIALDKELLQLVQGACKADNLQRALDVTRLMHNPATVDAAAKVAAFYHLPGLQERMQDVKFDIEQKRYTEQKSRRSQVHSNGDGHGGRNGHAKPGFSDFAPKASKRNFGGVPPGTGGGASYRDVTPLASGRSMDTFIPETPESEMRVFETPAPEERSVSPEFKRRRIQETPDEFTVPKQRDEFSLVNGEFSNGLVRMTLANK